MYYLFIVAQNSKLNRVCILFPYIPNLIPASAVLPKIECILQYFAEVIMDRICFNSPLCGVVWILSVHYYLLIPNSIIQTL